MSTLAIIAIVIGAAIVLAILVTAARRANRRRQLGQAQVEAKHDDVDHHRGRAAELRTEAAVAEERAKRARAEAELDESRAEKREEEVGDSR